MARPRPAVDHDRGVRTDDHHVAPAANSVLQPAMQRRRSAKYYLMLELTGASAKTADARPTHRQELATILYGSTKASLQCCGLPFRWYSNSS